MTWITFLIAAVVVILFVMGVVGAVQIYMELMFDSEGREHPTMTNRAGGSLVDPPAMVD